MGTYILYTGESLRTKLAAGYIRDEEFARYLLLQGASDQHSYETLDVINRRLADACFADSCITGECAHAMVGLMRYLAVGGLDSSRERLDHHLHLLAQNRDGKGRWRHFPFYYTLLALTEIDSPKAVEEIRYAQPACKKLLHRLNGDDTFSKRRKAVLQKIDERSQFTFRTIWQSI